MKKRLKGFILTKFAYLQHATLWNALGKHLLQGTLRNVWISFWLNSASTLPLPFSSSKLQCNQKNISKFIFCWVLWWKSRNRKCRVLYCRVRGILKTLSNISYRVFCENSWLLKAVNYFCRTLHLRCVTGFILNYQQKFSRIYKCIMKYVELEKC